LEFFSSSNPHLKLQLSQKALLRRKKMELKKREIDSILLSELKLLHITIKYFSNRKRRNEE
jgi:hypothetical protein